jgi:hypothetical protein
MTALRLRPWLRLSVGAATDTQLVPPRFEEALDLDALERARRDGKTQQERVGEMRDRLAESTEE